MERFKQRALRGTEFTTRTQGHDDGSGPTCGLAGHADRHIVRVAQIPAFPLFAQCQPGDAAMRQTERFQAVDQAGRLAFRLAIGQSAIRRSVSDKQDFARRDVEWKQDGRVAQQNDRMARAVQCGFAREFRKPVARLRGAIGLGAEEIEIVFGTQNLAHRIIELAKRDSPFGYRFHDRIDRHGRQQIGWCGVPGGPGDRAPFGQIDAIETSRPCDGRGRPIDVLGIVARFHEPSQGHAARRRFAQNPGHQPQFLRQEFGCPAVGPARAVGTQACEHPSVVAVVCLIAADGGRSQKAGENFGFPPTIGQYAIIAAGVQADLWREQPGVARRACFGGNGAGHTGDGRGGPRGGEGERGGHDHTRPSSRRVGEKHRDSETGTLDREFLARSQASGIGTSH